MKLKISKSNLLKGVQIVSKAVSTKTSMSILECILVDATNDEIKLIGNDTELGIETIIEGDIVSSGMVALECKVFSEIVRKLPDGIITIDTDDNFKTLIMCEKSKFTILGKDGREFTMLPQVEKNQGIYLSQFGMKEIVRQTIFSVGESETNKIMTGELFDIDGNSFKVVSLDGHRISIRKIELKDSYEPKKVIVPGKILNELTKIINGDMDQDIILYLTDRHILFEFDQTVMVSRLIEGEYFRIDQMLSSDYETKVTINRKEFLDCIDRATLLVKEGDKKPVIISINDDFMELKVNSVIGSMNEDITIEKEGKDLMIGFNPKFLIDALRVIDDETVDIYLVNPKAPCFIRDAAESYIYLVLPVNFTTVD